MRMDSTLNITPEGSLSDIPAATGGNADLMKGQQVLDAPEIKIESIQPSAAMLDQAEEISERTSNRQRAGQVDIPRRVLRMREVSQEDALASVRHFFVPGNGQTK